MYSKNQTTKAQLVVEEIKQKYSIIDREDLQ
jgi:hypothetical protein